MDHNNNFRKVTIGRFDLYKLISFSRKINLLGMEEHWKPYLNAKIFHRNNDSLLVYVNNSNRGIIYHRASLPTQIGLNERPLLLSLDYTSKSNNTQTKFLVEMRENNNSTNNAGKKILWNHLLQNTDGKLVQETFVLPSNIDNMPIEIRLYIITTERDNDSLFLKTFYISYT
jgi:hypothetical protein